MKKFTILFFFVFASVTAQKTDRTNFGSLQNIKASDYAVTFTSNFSKTRESNEPFKMVFINTITGKTNEVLLAEKTNIRKVHTDIEANFLGSKFVVVECYSEVEKRLPKASGFVSKLYLISLNDFKVTPISTEDFSLKNWQINTKTNKIVFIEQENGMKDLSGEVQKIMVFDLDNGTKKEVFSNN
ncbi:hypothetical protein [Flavobacterium aquatile]|uniref:Uncharacterized protein n=1 Tax=Flavobacterium aquatile LMG 4008 = ATCC 11947 TaxID=1453498 RepID=A0A095V360_9FLAO|nr:hypothetical protein [Flavobacterium aquatile]KGD69290.1 hypothetical protein LG45_00465 [Flavobacterium aquatile LMG 4008 = ATCC 11947]OXA69542.1 hypothetical protein B0A61_00440 [Flavobacterium aquatile LMG 4008 = ATCC 11947]GEC77753.1 hypothetical protein FAQ01_06230 [Flavobacterium aquatile]